MSADEDPHQTVPSSDKAEGNRCLFTNELLDEKTKIEHAIVHSLGGRVTSNRVISTSFNELSSQDVDPSAKLIYWKVMTELGPALPKELRRRGLQIQTPNHVGKYNVNEIGQLEMRGAVVEWKDDGSVDYIIGETEEVERISRQLELEPKNMREVEPDRKDVFFGKIPSVNPLIEACMLKCILQTFDCLLHDQTDRFTRSDKVHHCREIVRKFVQFGDQKEQREAMGQISLGLQYAPDLRGRYEQIVKDSGVESPPFCHQLIASGNPATRTLDAVIIIFGEDPHAFRLSNDWNEKAFTYVMTNGIMHGQSFSECVFLADSWTLGKPTLRKSFIISNDSVQRSDLEKAASEIATRRFSIYRMAVEYRQLHCDNSVIDQLRTACTRSWNASKRLDDAIFDRMIVLFDGVNLDSQKIEKFLNAMIPILDDAKVDSFDADNDAPSQGWDYWLHVHRSCFRALKQVIGEAGRIYVKKAWIEMSDPVPLQD